MNEGQGEVILGDMLDRYYRNLAPTVTARRNWYSVVASKTRWRYTILGR
jgi:hypothetical protein